MEQLRSVTPSRTRLCVAILLCVVLPACDRDSMYEKSLILELRTAGTTRGLVVGDFVVRDALRAFRFTADDTKLVPFPVRLRSVTFVGDGSHVGGISSDDSFVVVSSDGLLVRKLSIRAVDPFLFSALSQDLRRLAICGTIRSGQREWSGLTIFDIEIAKDATEVLFNSNQTHCTGASWSPKGDWLAVDLGERIQFLHTPAWSIAAELSGSLPDWAPNGGMLALRCGNSSLCIAEWPKLTVREVVPHHKNVTTLVRCSPDGKYILFGQVTDNPWFRSRLNVVSVNDGRATTITRSAEKSIGWNTGWLYVGVQLTREIFLPESDHRL